LHSKGIQACSGLSFISLNKTIVTIIVIDLNGRQEMQSKVIITMFSLFAELERDLISERTEEGLARAKEQGKLLGRPKGSLGKSKLDGTE
jgi:DNA invertase Pin-like site-specific DNA recombinase